MNLPLPVLDRKSRKASGPARNPSLRREQIAGLSVLRRSGATDRPPAVFLHGIGSDAESWLALTGFLDGEREILCWNAPGYGASQALCGPEVTVDSYADALDALLQALDYKSVILTGHSLGALIAGRLAATRPGRVAALALLSPALGYKMAPGACLPDHVQARIDDLDRLGPAQFAGTRGPRLVHEPEAHPALTARITATMARVRQPGYGHAVHALASGDLAADAMTIEAPTLVVTGAQDRVTPPEGAARIHALLKNPRGLFEIEQTGHALPQQAPQRTAQILSSFFENATKP